MLNREPSLTKAVNNDLLSPLHMACHAERFTISQLLISKMVNTYFNTFRLLLMKFELKPLL